MRTTSGRVVLVVLLSCSLCGCRGGSNMFSWSRKKPSDSALADAPAFNPGSPTLPSAGQSPGATPSNVPGAQLTAGSTPTAPGTALASSAGSNATQSGYQQAVYPTTNYDPPRINQMGASGTPSPWSSQPVNNPGPAIGYVASTSPQTGFGYGPGSSAQPGLAATSAPAAPAASATAATQPQSGFYNPAYNSGASAPGYNNAYTPSGGTAQSPPAYASAGVNPSYGGAPTATQPPADAGPQYRTADIRNAPMAGNSYSSTMQTIAPAATAPAAAPPATSMVGDRYANMAGATPAANSYTNPAPTVPQQQMQLPQSPTPPAAQSPAPIGPSSYASPVGDRYSQPASDYRPGQTGYEPGNTGYQPPAVTPPPGAQGYPQSTTPNMPGAGGYNPPNVYGPGASTMPAASTPATRPDPGYRPGGTSSYTPSGGKNTEKANVASGPESRPQPARVTPASYMAPVGNETASSTMPTSPMLLSAPDPLASSGEMGRGSEAAVPAYGASDAEPSEPGLFPGHAW